MKQGLLKSTLVIFCVILILLTPINGESPPIEQKNSLKIKQDILTVEQNAIQVKEDTKDIEIPQTEKKIDEKQDKEKVQQKNNEKKDMENDKFEIQQKVDQSAQSSKKQQEVKPPQQQNPEKIDKSNEVQKPNNKSNNIVITSPQQSKIQETTPNSQTPNKNSGSQTVQIPPPQQPSIQPLPQFQRQIGWPIQNQLYHIYSAKNPRLVLDVAKASDGFHDLILYNWQTSLNQMYFFKRVTKNLYHIINAESGEYMKKSQKVTQRTFVPKVKFSQGEEKLWQLIPAKLNAQNSFYIKSTVQDIALDLNQGYANIGAQIILYEFHKNDNQVWFIRKNQTLFQINQLSIQKYQEKVSELLYKVMSVEDSINQCITLEEIKKEMEGKKIALPEWIARPGIPELYQFQLPQEVLFRNLTVLERLKKRKFNNKMHESSSLTKQEQVSKEVSQQRNTSTDKTQHQSQKQFSINFNPQKLTLQCAKHHTIAYIWYGAKPMPRDYQELLTKCKNNVRLLTEKDFDIYVEQWNAQNPVYAIDTPDYIIRQRVNLLKLLYLYYESGIYSDFDTQINEQCFEGIFADEIIWTSRLDENINDAIIFPLEQIVVPEESFMMITAKQHPQVKRMLQQEIMEHNLRGGERWKECKFRQCLIVQCQRHYRDNTYKKGFD